MSAPPTAPKPLLLAGGKSTRLGSPKHLLPMPDGQLLYKHQIDLLRQACPGPDKVYISLARESTLDPTLQQAMDSSHIQDRRAVTTAEIDSLGITIIYDLEANDTTESAGPAAGLLAAYRFDPAATWMVIACDYPLLTLDALEKLRSSYKPPVTCFRNPDGFCEPLLAIWSPEALRRLAENVKQERAGPTSVIRQLNGRTLDANGASERLFLNVNTRNEWTAALSMMGQTPER